MNSILVLAAAKDLPLIDLDSTVFVQLALFLVTAFVLSRVLFRPYLAVRAAREQGIEGARDEARRMEEEARARMDQYEQSMAAARAKAADERNRLRAEAARREREIAEAARQKAAAALEEARRKIAVEEREARQELEPRAREIAASIARKILGRELA